MAHIMESTWRPSQPPEFQRVIQLLLWSYTTPVVQTETMSGFYLPTIYQSRWAQDISQWMML